jgi:polysaccharide export outer membrane protein
MGRDDGNHDGENAEPDQETLSFAEFVNRGDLRPGADCAALVLGDSVDAQMVFPLTRNSTVIGQSNNADVVLTDPAVSDFHARILKHSFGYTVEDLGSAEGTFLRDRRVKHARLVDGDILRLGTTALTFLGEQASAPKAKSLALVPVRSTARGLAPRQVVLRNQYSQPRNLEDTEVLPDRTPARKERSADSDEAEPSIEDVLLKLISAFHFIRRHALLIYIFAVTGLGLGAASFEYYPPVRAAQCLVTLYSAPKTNPIAPEEHQAQSDSMQFFVGAERAFTSPETIMATLKRLGVPHPNEWQAESIGKQMRFERLDSNTYSGTLTPKLFDRRDESHVQFLDTHVKNYIETEIEKKLKVFVAEVDFLRSQTEAADKRLQDISQQTVQFREANSDQILAQSTLDSSPAELETRRIALSGEINRLAGELEGVRSQLARASVLSQAKTQSVQPDREALASVNRKLAELRAQDFADGHPAIQQLLSQQRALQRVIDDHLHAEVTQFEKRSNVAYDSLQSQADQLEAQLRAARSELGFIEANRRSLRTVSSESPKVNARLDELLRMKEDAVRQHGLLFDRLKKAEVQLQLERVSTSSRYEIVVPAHLDHPPGRKAFAARLALGLGLGLLLAALVLGIIELRRMIVRVARATATSAILLAFLGSLALGCAHDERFTWVEDLPAKNPGSEPVIHPRDTLQVEVNRQPTLSGEFIVRDDGHYSQPMVGSIHVADQTPSQAASAITDALKGVVVAPVVSVWISKTTSIRVSVVGEVKTPGTYELTRDRGLLPALALAGWLTEFAHSDRVFVVRVRTNERIRFRVQDITTAEAHAAEFQLADGDVVVVE